MAIIGMKGYTLKKNSVIANDNIDTHKYIDVVDEVLNDVKSILDYSSEDQEDITLYKEKYLGPVYERIKNNESFAGSIPYNQFVQGYSLGSEGLKEYFKDAFVQLRVLYFLEKIQNNLFYLEKSKSTPNHIVQSGTVFYDSIAGYIKDLHALDKDFDFASFDNQFIDKIAQDLHSQGLLSVSG